jgi:hypothetical protein
MDVIYEMQDYNGTEKSLSPSDPVAIAEQWIHFSCICRDAGINKSIALPAA